VNGGGLFYDGFEGKGESRQATALLVTFCDFRLRSPYLLQAPRVKTGLIVISTPLSITVERSEVITWFVINYIGYID
jgi:hypothetical protein